MFFLQNKTPHKKMDKTSYELWKGYQPNLKYLRVWGCLAKVMLPDPKKRKIGSKTSLSGSLMLISPFLLIILCIIIYSF